MIKRQETSKVTSYSSIQGNHSDVQNIFVTVSGLREILNFTDNNKNDI